MYVFSCNVRRYLMCMGLSLSLDVLVRSLVERRGRDSGFNPETELQSVVSNQNRRKLEVTLVCHTQENTD